ncbi:putative lipid phosphate phosphatase [Wickerhamomyces ciferrii]|uniref:Lipid phosphate phosphatase n=1 Tax=Wickerhamomyces ciferrii (strain ATCC 14091 / BCRC 22168 / CBS 111 / JCM 3599 / NBRC 0793 / NRRL Y-1031 F-60-10) TaxID=1206466 RepID=K0KL73_WICCF|nr:putative lipid phosphate phosphatase [Wickerhamomyces ciferrii]CCH41848.1 putative lipid phosphate phosphatase [Wickerhamomyces ciferrii]
MYQIFKLLLTQNQFDRKFSERHPKTWMTKNHYHDVEYFQGELFEVLKLDTAPRYTEFSLADDKISFTFYREQDNLVGRLLLMVVSIAVPIAQVILMFGFARKSSARKIWNIHSALLSLLAIHTYQAVIVSILKNVVGSPRPDLLQRCLPTNYALPPYGHLSNVGICGNRNIGDINDGFRSFPSGHASTSFASALFSFFITSSRIKVFDERGNSFKTISAYLPFFISTFMTATRISDNRHSFVDIFIGSLIGLGSGYLGYHMYFPDFRNLSLAGMALPPRRIGNRGKNGQHSFWKVPEDNDYDYDSRASDIEFNGSSLSLSTDSSGSPSPPKSRHSIASHHPSRSRPQTSINRQSVRSEKLNESLV